MTPGRIAYIQFLEENMDKFEQYLIVMMSTPIGFDPRKATVLWGVPTNVIGPPGVAKTKRISAIAGVMGIQYFGVWCATKEPQHFAGVYVPTPDGVSIECGMPQVKACMELEDSVLNLDEISSATRATQSACMSFVDERQVGEYQLPPGTRIVLAMNPADIAANGRDLEVPLANRMAHYSYTPPTPDAWHEWMKGRYKMEDVQQMAGSKKVVIQRWFEHYDNVADSTWEFIKAGGGTWTDKSDGDKGVKRNKFIDVPEEDDPRAGGPWPSLRTWSMAIWAETTRRCLEVEDRIAPLIVGSLVGEGLATEWTAYMAKKDLPSPQDALTGKWKMSRRLDIVRTVLDSTGNWVVAIEDEKERFEYAVLCWQFIQKAIDKGYADSAKLPAGCLIAADLDVNCPNTKVSDIAEEVCNNLGDTGQLKYIQ